MEEGTLAGTSTSYKDLSHYKLDSKDHFNSSEAASQEEDIVKCLTSDQDGFFYIPDFISEQEEEYLLDKVSGVST
jgi:hypothetical protein